MVDTNLLTLRMQLQLAVSQNASTFVMETSELLDLVERCQDAEDEIAELEREGSRKDDEIQELVDRLQGEDEVWADGVN